MHGISVETRDTFFIEGVWNGDFERGQFGSTECVFGSGAIRDDDGILFVTSCATTDGLFYVERDRRVLVSNSLPMLLAAADDELDRSYEHYYEDGESVTKGINAYARVVKTRRGRVNWLLFRSLRVTGQSVSLVDKPLPPPFGDFRSYQEYLETRYQQIAANARSSSRRCPLDIFSTQSRGYDSTAINALASRHGIDRVFTVRQSKSMDDFAERRNAGQQSDDGTAICNALGLPCTQIDRKFYQTSGYPDEYLLYASQPAPQDSNLLGIHPYIERPTMLLTGILGEIWGDPEYYRTRAGLLGPDIRRADSSGHALTEARLRVGYVQVSIPYLGARRRDAIYAITNSREMDPWRINPAYDRPIPRRIAEERGVQRELFGQIKVGSVVTFPTPRIPYGESLRREYLDWLVESKRLSRSQAQLWRWVHVWNGIVDCRSPDRFWAVYYAERVVARLTRRELLLKHLWGRLSGSLFCFCVNKCVREYRHWLGTGPHRDLSPSGISVPTSIGSD
jgi:hypothetical protein